VLGETLPWDDDTFAAVFSTGVFTEGHAPASAMYELVRITRPGGHIILTVRDIVLDARGFRRIFNELAGTGRWTLIEESPTIPRLCRRRAGRAGQSLCVQSGLSRGLHHSPAALFRRRRRPGIGVARCAYLSISQSAVTEAIKELEADLGVELFERHARGLNVTHKGHQFLRHATNILSNVSDARRAFADSPEAITGKLSLGVTSMVAGYVLSDLLARYRRAYPNVDVTAIEDNGDYLEHLLIGGELDVAVMVISNLRDRMALQAEIWKSRPIGSGCRSGHKLAAAEVITLTDVASEPLIMLTIDEIEENTGRC
jgi:hypothetical protein